MAKRKRRSSSTAKRRVQVRTSSNGSNTYCDYKGLGWLFFIVGILYLFTDLGWIGWWTIQWWTILFLLMGIKWIKK